MNGTIITAFYNDEDKQSCVVKATKNGIFAGTTMAAPEDWSIANKWDGQTFAEYLADVEILKDKAMRMRERATGVETVYKNLAQENDVDDAIMKKLKRQSNIAWRDAEIAKENYEEMRDAYLPYTEMRLKCRRDVREKIEERK